MPIPEDLFERLERVQKADLKPIEVITATNREGVTFALSLDVRRSFPLATLNRVTFCDGQGGATVLANEARLYEIVNMLTGNSAWDVAVFKEYERRPTPDRIHSIVKGPGENRSRSTPLA